MSTQRYLSMDLAVTADPGQIATCLAIAAGSDDHVVYENPPVWSFARGRIAEVIVTPSRSILRDERGERAVPHARGPLSGVAALLREVPVAQWRAYGIAMFDLSRALTGAGAGAVDAEAVLLRLLIPRLEVRIRDGRARLRGTNDAELRRTAELMAATAPRRRQRTIQVDVTREVDTDYRSMVSLAVQEIRKGGLQKVVLSRPVPIEADVDLPGTFLAGRARTNPARSFLLRMGGLAAAGFSPETIAEIGAAGRVRTQLLAGTAALVPGDDARNELLGAAMLNDPKEVYEHASAVHGTVTAMRGVCTADSVVIKDFMHIHRRGSAQHIGSVISGSLAAGRGPWDAFGALSPTLIGRPRDEAYAVIRASERSPRGLYGGAVLTVDSAGELDAALAIRTVFQQDGRSWLHAGAGICPQSTPDREFEETCEKLRGLAAAIVVRDQ
jgi:salicylate synthase